MLGKGLGVLILLALPFISFGSPSVNLCSDLYEFNNLLLGIKHGLLKIFLASAFLVGLASASATVMRVKGWI